MLELGLLSMHNNKKGERGSLHPQVSIYLEIAYLHNKRILLD